MPAIMNLKHPRFEEFIARLEGPAGCNFREVAGQPVWDCKEQLARPHACAILQSMGFAQNEISKSLEFFESRGGFCDCEIVLNVGSCS